MLITCADKHLSSEDLASWIVPEAGMFVWFKLHGVDDTEKLLGKLEEEKIAVVPGKYFMPDSFLPETEEDSIYCPYIRVAFTVATDDKMDEGMSRLAKILREYTTVDKK